MVEFRISNFGFPPTHPVCPQMTQITQIKTQTFGMSSASIRVICGKLIGLWTEEERLRSA